MKYGFGAVMLTLMGITLSPNTMAACGQITTQCLVFNNGAESTESCEITLCANTNEYIADWTLANGGAVSERTDNNSRVIQVDDQPGVSLPETILKEGFTCYASGDSRRLYCAKDVWL